MAHTHAVCCMSPGLLLYPSAALCSAHNKNVGQADPIDRHRLVHAGEISKGYWDRDVEARKIHVTKFRHDEQRLLDGRQESNIF